MAFSGTLVASGRGTGVVVGTAANTELGRINQMMTAVSALETPLLRQIKMGPGSAAHRFALRCVRGTEPNS